MLAFVGLAVVHVHGAMAAAKPTPTPTPAPTPPPPPPLPDSLGVRWAQHGAELGDATTKGTDAAWNDILTAKGFLGVPRAEPFAVLELARGLQQIHARDFADAEKSLDRALKLDPDLWSVYHAQAVLELKRSPFAVLSAISLETKALSGRLDDDESRYFFALAARIAGAVACGIFALLVAVSAVLRHGSLLRHDVQEFFAGSFSHEFNGLLAWVFLMLPFLAWLGFYWAAIYWLVVLMVYMRVTERVVAGLALCCCAASPWLAETALTRSVPLMSPSTSAVLGASWGLGAIGARIGALEETVEQVGGVDCKRLLAYALRDNGKYDEARKILEELSGEEPDDASVLLDIGNIYAITGDDGLALYYYTQAADKDKEYAVAYYNMGIAQAKQLRLQDAEAVKKKAKLMDPTLLEKVARFGGVSVLDDRPAFGELLRILDRTTPESSYRGLRARLPSASPLFQPFVLAPLIALGAAIALCASRKEHHARRCDLCSQPHCRHCKSEREREDTCSACLHIFVKKEGIAKDAHKIKQAAIDRTRRTEKILRLVLAILAPGVSQQHAGRTLLGALLIAMTSSALALFLAGGTFQEPIHAIGAMATRRGIPGIVLYVIALGVSVAVALHDREVEGEV